MSIAGSLEFNPLKDSIVNNNGEKVFLDEPEGDELPSRGFDVKDNGFLDPSNFVLKTLKLKLEKTLNVYNFLSLLISGIMKIF